MYSCARRSGATVARCPWICRKGCQLLEEQQPVKIPVNCGSPVRHWFLIWPIRWQFTPSFVLPDCFKLKSCSAKWPVVHGIISPLVWLHYKLYRKLSDSKAILSAVYCLIPRLSYLSHGDLGLRSCTANCCNCLLHKIQWLVSQLVGPAPPPLLLQIILGLRFREKLSTQLIITTTTICCQKFRIEEEGVGRGMKLVLGIHKLLIQPISDHPSKSV